MGKHGGMEAWSQVEGEVGEIDIFAASKIAIYNGDVQKKPVIESVEVRLTNRRIIAGGQWCISLADLERVESRPGFLTSSPKIHLHVKRKMTSVDWKCPACDEMNKVSVRKCVLCGTLNRAAPMEVSSGSHLVRLSFRGSGHTRFFAHVTKAASAKEETEAPQDIVVGVSGLLRKAEQEKGSRASQHSAAFSDLDALLGQAEQMGKLADQIAAKVSEGSGEDQEFKALISDLGFTGTGVSTQKSDLELVRSITAFALRLFSLKSTKVIALADFYCLYNRARGTALISPGDLVSACQNLNGDVILKKLNSGLLVLQSKAYSSAQLADRINQAFEDPMTSFITASDLSKKESISVQLATELLQSAEQTGRLARDSSSSGLRFYCNLISLSA